MKASKSSMWSSAAGCILAAAISALGVSPSMATDTNALNSLQLHGFLSQAYIVTDHNNFYGSSSDGNGSWDYTELGFNASLRPTKNLLIAAQALSRRAGKDDDGSPTLDYGIIDWQMLSTADQTFGIQLGRFKNPLGFYNQTRDVAFTRPSILLPQSIYFDRTRSVAMSGDGVSLYHEARLDNGGLLHSQFGVGRSQAGDDAESSLGLDGLPGSLEGDLSVIGQVRYEHDGGRIVLAVSAASVHEKYESPGDFPGDGEFTFQPLVLSAQYNAERWSLTGEYALRRVETSGFNAFDDISQTGESWYVQYTRRFLDDWQWLVRYDTLVHNRNDPNGHKYEAAGLGPAYSQYADDLTFGVQWTPHPNVMLSGEYHHVDGTGWLSLQDNPDASQTEQIWNMWLMQLSLRF
uniref:hypothetical protein n=1 Tax=Halomonas sp. TaxID=1486246 RepID=UPI00260C4BD4|nr:hypothetical protein [Halomonas sp.]